MWRIYCILKHLIIPIAVVTITCSSEEVEATEEDTRLIWYENDVVNMYMVMADSWRQFVDSSFCNKKCVSVNDELKIFNRKKVGTIFLDEFLRILYESYIWNTDGYFENKEEKFLYHQRRNPTDCNPVFPYRLEKYLLRSSKIEKLLFKPIAMSSALIDTNLYPTREMAKEMSVRMMIKNFQCEKNIYIRPETLWKFLNNNCGISQECGMFRIEQKTHNRLQDDCDFSDNDLHDPALICIPILNEMTTENSFLLRNLVKKVRDCNSEEECVERIIENIRNETLPKLISIPKDEFFKHLETTSKRTMRIEFIKFFLITIIISFVVILLHEYIKFRRSEACLNLEQ